MTDPDPKARERAQQWYNRWVQENFFGSSRNTVDSLAQLLLQVQAEARLAALEQFGSHDMTSYGSKCRLCEEIGALREQLADLRSQAGAEGGK